MATNEPKNSRPMHFAKGRRKKKKKKITGPIYVSFYRDDDTVVEIDWTWRPKIPPRYYGVFICRKFSCGRRWESSWTWLGRRQKCHVCRKYTIPSYVEELKDRNYWVNISGHNGGNFKSRPFHKKPPKEQHDIEGCEYCKELLIKLGINCTQLPKDQYGIPGSYLDARKRPEWDEISLMSDDTSSVCSSIENNQASLTVDDDDDDDDDRQSGFSDISENFSDLNI